jgi:PIN domain nuclease of toxin-antitoxin system
MRLLLDSHAFLWCMADPGRLSHRVFDLLSDPANVVLTSIGTIWELSIKKRLGRLDEDLWKAVDDSPFPVLPLTTAHVRQVFELPFVHRDPFDRMLIAQAIVEDLRLVSRDATVAKYGIPTIW